MILYHALSFPLVVRLWRRAGGGATASKEELAFYRAYRNWSEMRQYPDVPSVIRTDLTFNFGGPGGGFHLFHSYATTDNTLGTYNSWCNWVNTSWENEMASQVATGINLSLIKVTDLSTRTGIVTSQPGSANGAKAGFIPPDNACVLVNYKINRRYRGGQPRSYMPGGVAQDVTNGNTWSTAMVTAYQNAVGVFFTSLTNFSGNLTGLKHVNVSYFQGDTWFQKPNGSWERLPTFRTAPLLDAIVNATPSARIGSQRRRLRLGG